MAIHTVGMGGGGEMSAPSLSPQLTSNLPRWMFLGCDLLGLYRFDGTTQTWDFVDQRQMRAEQLAKNLGGKNIPGCRVAFDSNNPGTLYKYGQGRGLRKSTDAGDSWPIVCVAEPDPLDPATFVLATAIQVDPADSMFVIYGRKAGGAFYSTNAGVSFTACTATAAIGEVVAIVIFPAAPTGVARFYIATVGDVFHSIDGKNWTHYGTAFGSQIKSFAAGGSSTTARLYALVTSSSGSDPGIRVLDPSSGGWTSPTAGLNTQTNTDPDGCKTPTYLQLAAANNDPMTAYVTVCARYSPGSGATLKPNETIGVFKTVDGGANWAQVFHARDPNFDAGYLTTTANVEAGWKEGDLDSASASTANAIACCPTSSSIVLVSNQVADLSTDGGATWKQVYTTGTSAQVPAKGAPWSSRGLEPTTVWDYVVNPANPQLRFIAYTDIGLSRSADGGVTWRHVVTNSLAGRRLDNCYGLAFHDTAPNQIWAACATLHDIPARLHARCEPLGGDGGVLSSNDGGVTWTDVSTSTMKGACTCVLFEPGMTPRLWAVVFGVGIFRTNANAINWSDVTKNLPRSSGSNRGFYSLRFHERTGNIYLSVAGLPTSAGGSSYYSTVANQGGVYLWDESGKQWLPLTNATNTSDGRIWNVMDFNVHPDDPNRIFVGLQGGKNESGLNPVEGPYGSAVRVDYKPATSSSSVSDLNVPLLATNYSDTIQVFGVWFAPQDPNALYVTSTSHGVWYSADGSSWVEYKAIPYQSVQRIRWQQNANGEPTSLLFATFGGGAWQLNRLCFVVNDLSKFSNDQVAATPKDAQGHRLFVRAFYVVCEGFSPSDLGFTSTTQTLPPPSNLSPLVDVLQPDGTTSANPTAAVDAVFFETSPVQLGTVQRIVFSYTLTFTDLTPFNTPGVYALHPHLDSQMLDGEGGAITLVNLPHPYMLDGPVGWLSQDLRVFQVTEGQSPAWWPTGQTAPTAGSDPIAYLSTVLNDMRTPAVPNNNPFDSISQDQSASALSISQQDSHGKNIWNYAIAKVRYRGQMAVAKGVQVFFRLCSTAHTGLDFDKTTAYRRDESVGKPLLGTQRGQLVTIPCFDQLRVTTVKPMSQQPDGNVHDFAATGSSSDEEVWYYGAWLDVNQTTKQFPRNPANDGPYDPSTSLSVMDLVAGEHQCLVAEIYYPPPPPLDPIVAGETPGSSDKLAQRNLLIVPSPNPGPPEGHRVQHTFELRIPPHVERGAGGAAVEQELGPRDELLLFWGRIPRTSKATIYLPGADADEIVAEARRRGGASPLHRIDEHTIECAIGDVTFVPLPRSPKHLRGLLTIEVHDARIDNDLRVIARQVDGGRRSILGSFELLVPIRPTTQLLAPELRRLATLRWIAKSIPRTDDWAPVFDRYLQQIADRVRAYGGHPDTVEPSPTGNPPETCCHCVWRAISDLFRGRVGLAAFFARIVYCCRGD